MRSIYKFMLTTIAVLFFAIGSFAQLTVSVTGEGNTTPNLSTSYGSFAAALTDLNAITAMTGPVTFTLATGSETAPVKGFVLGSAGLNPLLSATNTITINTSGAVTINAGVGTATPGSASPDGMFVINGADYVTIDGITFTDGNTTNPATMEFGIALFKRAAGDGSNFNTIQNCTFNMQRVNNASGSGPLVDGSVGIGVYNSVYTAATTALTPTNGGTLATNGTNSNNRFYGNSFNGGNYGIAMNGFAATAGVGPAPNAATFLGDLNNDIGGTDLATGNTILNYGGGGTDNPAAGIRANNQWSVNISYNTLNNNDGSGVNHNGTLRGIFAQAGTSANATITFNNITIKGGGTTTLVVAIENGIGATAASNTVNINNNTISGEYLTATTGAFYGIYNSSTAATVNANNNSVNGWSYSTAANTGTGVVYPIWLAGAGTDRTANNNTVNNVTRIGSTGGNTIGIYISAGTNQTTNENTVTNMSISGAGTAGFIYGIQTTGTTVVMNNNQINNLSCIKTTGTGNLYGIYNAASPTNENYNNNTIHSLTHNGTGPVFGIYAWTGTGTRTISGNTVHTLSTNGGTTIAGINSRLSTPNVFNNKIYGITSTSAGAPTVCGIFLQGVSSGTANIYNNLIGDLTAPNASGTDVIRGIDIPFNTVISVNVSYNTVYINASSSGTNFGTTGIFTFASTTSVSTNLTLRNNIIVNLSQPKGSGRTVAYRRSGIALDNYNSASNNNLFFAGTPGAANLIFFDGTNSDQTIAAYQTRVAPRDAVSFTENPVFQSTTGSSADFLKIDLTTPTQIKNGGQPITGIADDYWGTLRDLIAPSVGAFEANMATIDLVVSNQQTISINSTYNNLTITSSGQLTVNAGVTLNVNGNFTIESNSSGTGSLVQEGNSVINITGTTLVQQYLTGTGTLNNPTGRGWYVSSPLVGATSGTFIPTYTNKIWSHSEYDQATSASGYTEITNNLSSLTTGRGYVVRLGANSTVSFEGTAFNTGNLSFPGLTRTGTTDSKRGFHLMGNPYPSYLNWDNVTKTNIDVSMWYRTTNTSGTMVFDTYNASNGEGTNNNMSGAVTKFIPPMQGFWIKVTTDGQTGTLGLNNSMRSHQSGNLLKTTSQSEILRLNISNGTNSDEAIIIFNQSAGTGLTSWDSEKMMNSSASVPQIFSKEGSTNLVINSLPEITNGLTVPLFINLGEAGQFSINPNLSELDPFTVVTLQDLQLGIFHDLSNGAYNFTSTVVNNSNRFVLHFNTVLTDGNLSETNTSIYAADNKLHINSPTEGSLEVFDLLGKRIIKTELNSGMNIITLNSKGVYLVKVSNRKQVIIEKVSLW